MAGIVHQQPPQGWGTGHQGERIFSTVPGAYPGGGGYLQNEDSDGSEEEPVNPYDAIYGELNLHRVYGQQLAIWTHKNPDTLSLFTPVPGDSFMSIVSHARMSLDFNTAVDKMMVLLPGHKRPLDMDSVFIVKPGTAILIVPLYDYMVSIDIKQLGHKVDMVVSITMTVHELKLRLQTEQGYPADRMDLLYRDQPLENSRYLFEYGLAHSSTLFVLLMFKYDMLIHVETFWGKQYHLYMDSCNTGYGVFASILSRTISHNSSDATSMFDLLQPKDTLVLYFGSRAIDWNRCLGFYNIESGSVLRMLTIGLAHRMDIQKVPIVLDDGKIQHLTASKFDRWSAIVLKLHGLTGYPVNLMRLVWNGKVSLDISDIIGSVSKNRDTVGLNISAVKMDDDFLYGIPLKFKIGMGITELLKVAPNRTIQYVKNTLEKIGVPNASLHDLMVEGYRLPNHKRIVDVIEEYKVPVELSLRQYPVYIHGHQNIIYKMLAYSKESLATFLMRVNMKTGLSFKDFLILSCGNILNDDENKPVFDTKISVKSSVFLIPRKQYRSFLILHDDWMTKLRIPAHPKIKQIKDILWKERKVPEGGLASIGNFLQWYFAGHYDDKGDNIQTPLKERMLVYEANVGDKYMQVRVEPPHGRKKRTKNKHRTRSQPANQPTDRLLLPQLPRHLSADGHPRRKARTTVPKHRLGPKRRALTTLPKPTYKYRVSGGEKGDNNKDEGEMVFCLRHDYTLNMPTRKQTSYH